MEQFKSPNSKFRDLICNKNTEMSFENLMKKSVSRDYKSIGNASTNDRSRSSFKTYDYDDKSDKSDILRDKSDDRRSLTDKSNDKYE